MSDAVIGRDPMPPGGWPLVMAGEDPVRWPRGGGMPCSDCCHSRFGNVAEGVIRITVNWPCQQCGRTVGELGGYHYRHECETPLEAP